MYVNKHTKKDAEEALQSAQAEPLMMQLINGWDKANRTTIMADIHYLRDNFEKAQRLEWIQGQVSRIVYWTLMVVALACGLIWKLNPDSHFSISDHLVFSIGIGTLGASILMLGSSGGIAESIVFSDHHFPKKTREWIADYTERLDRFQTFGVHKHSLISEFPKATSAEEILQTIDQEALKIFTDEKALPQQSKSKHESAELHEARSVLENQRGYHRGRIVRASRFNITDGNLTPIYDRAEQEWLRQASLGMVGIDYVI